MGSRVLVAGLAVLLYAAGVWAQTTPTGSITGQVVDAQGAVLPGVTVSVTSPALQGTRTAVTSGNGDYIVPFLPTGDYEVTFELAGFEKRTEKVRVPLAETITLGARLGVAGVSEQLTVRAELPADFTSSSTVASSYRSEMIDRLPVGRDVNGAVLLAPGTTDTGPQREGVGQVVFSGAMAYEGLFLINGVVANETLRGQVSTVFIEDAIQETKISTASVSAEYGRFNGGVANTITKSGGNKFSGSFRTTLTNDDWRALTPFEKELSEDPRVSKVVPAYEATFGGPVIKDRLWFFGAARLKEDTFSQTTFFTNFAYDNRVDDKRLESKLTYAMTAKHTFKGSFIKRTRDEFNNSFGDVMDRASFYDNKAPEDLLSANYTGILTPKLFVEAQFSRRQNFFIGSGSRFTDLPRGTMILDRSRGNARWNSPTFCGVCGLSQADIDAGKLNEEFRGNKNAIVKGSYFLSTSRAGSHSLVFGGDAFQDSRKNDNYQSGSGFRLFANNTIIRGEDLFPVIIPGTSDTQTSAAYILWNPLPESSQGSQLRTYSAFVNDVWRFNNRLTLNVGARWDKLDEQDQGGATVADGSTWSPRLSASFDPTASGAWVINAGFARYVMPVSSGIADAGSGAGRTSTFRYVYRGPAINTNLNTANPVSAQDALTTVFDWFAANGGTNRPLRDNPTFAGLSRRVGEDLSQPTSWESVLGLAGRLGTKGSFRVDAVHRDYDNFYADSVVPGRTVTAPNGRVLDLAIVETTNLLERKYRALQGQIQYRLVQDVTIGGNYTLSRASGNVNGENAASGPTTDDILAYAEYQETRWSKPIGDLSIDQRHKLRLWANVDAGLGRVGRLNIGVLQSLNSGTPYSVDAVIDSRSFVTNPGYQTPDSSIDYFFDGRGSLRNDTISATDLSFNYSLPIGRLNDGAFFARFVVNNVFNRAGQDSSGNETVFTASNQNPGATLQRFNPFTETPQLGVHYELGPNFGIPLSADDYQASRTYYFALGFRF